MRAVRAFDPCTLVILCVLVLLPFQGVVLLHSSGRVWDAARYGPELFVDVVALWALIARHSCVVTRLKAVAWPVIGLVAFWLVGAAWNAVSLQTTVIGLRSELRFVAAAIVVAAAPDPLRDVRLYARVLCAGAATETLVAFVQARNGVYYSIGTFEQRHLLGSYVALGAIVALAARSRGLGVSPRVAAAAFAIAAAGVLISASRQAAIFAVAGSAAIVFVRAGRRARIAIGAVAAAAVAAIAVATVSGPSTRAFDAHGLVKRWELFFSNGALSPTTNFRMQLLLDDAKLVARLNPVAGVGVGTASAPSVINNLTSPAYRAFRPDVMPTMTPFLYDNNWATILLETGFVGCAVLALVLARLAWIGLRAAHVHWSGVAVTGLIAGIVLLGFMAPSLQQPLVSLVLWLLVGVVGVTTVASKQNTILVVSAGSSPPPRRRRSDQHVGVPDIDDAAEINGHSRSG